MTTRFSNLVMTLTEIDDEGYFNLTTQDGLPTVASCPEEKLGEKIRDLYEQGKDLEITVSKDPETGDYSVVAYNVKTLV